MDFSFLQKRRALNVSYTFYALYQNPEQRMQIPLIPVPHHSPEPFPDLVVEFPVGVLTKQRGSYGGQRLILEQSQPLLESVIDLNLSIPPDDREATNASM